MSKRIVLDLTKCEGCESCTVRCGYFYRPHEADHGIQSLKERATFMIVCRRCEHAGCVASCPYDALERQADGVIKRYNLRCV
ncbi:MAG: 4Fe-4S ferredoxin, partial [Planctomycetales bacterium]|nr:4Fe-4S ferredoxin [Planctomycetales bacterium]